MKKISVILVFLFLGVNSFSQVKMKKPSVMVIPSNAWCKDKANSRGTGPTTKYVQQFNNQGSIETYPDFKLALESDVTLKQVLVSMSGVLKDRGFTMKMLEAQMAKIDKKIADQNARMSKTGGEVMMSPTDMLKMTAKADIIMEITYTVVKHGPRSSISFTLAGLDAGTGTLVADAVGNSEPAAGSIAELMTEAVSAYMDGFCSKLMDHFIDMRENGREINLNVYVWDDWGEDLETEDYGDDELSTVIEDWVSDNTVNSSYNLSDATENMMVFEMTRIPTIYTDKKGREKAMDAAKFGKLLRDYLGDLGLESKGERSSLSEMNIWIGHK